MSLLPTKEDKAYSRGVRDGQSTMPETIRNLRDENLLLKNCIKELEQENKKLIIERNKFEAHLKGANKRAKQNRQHRRNHDNK